jgi:hypothetical protein
LLHKQKQEEIEIKKLRVNKKRGGKKPKLSEKEQILLTLIYLRHSPTFQLLGIQFGVSETTANDIFHYWLPIISEALPPTLIEQVKKCEGDYEWLQELLSELQLIVDTERTSQREALRLPRAKTVLLLTGKLHSLLFIYDFEGKTTAISPL